MIPQGSVLGPLLFSVYTSPIGEVVSKFGVHFHQFADDMLIYLALSDTSNNLVTLDQCTNAVKAWYLQNDLLLNANKSEVMFVGTTKSLESVKNVTSVNVAGTSLPVTKEIKSLGVILDSRLNLDSHVRAVCKSCRYHT